MHCVCNMQHRFFQRRSHRHTAQIQALQQFAQATDALHGQRHINRRQFDGAEQAPENQRPDARSGVFRQQAKRGNRVWQRRVGVIKRAQVCQVGQARCFQLVPSRAGTHARIDPRRTHAAEQQARAQRVGTQTKGHHFSRSSITSARQCQHVCRRTDFSREFHFVGVVTQRCGNDGVAIPRRAHGVVMRHQQLATARPGPVRGHIQFDIHHHRAAAQCALQQREARFFGAIPPAAISFAAACGNHRQRRTQNDIAVGRIHRVQTQFGHDRARRMRHSKLPKRIQHTRSGALCHHRNNHGRSSPKRCAIAAALRASLPAAATRSNTA